MHKKLYLIGAAGVLALAMACGDKNPSPAAPTPATTSGTTGSEAAAADGSTLKVPPPTPTSPANGTQTVDFNIVLKVNPVTAKFVNISTFAYHFQILLNGQVVREFRTSAGTQWAVEELDSNVTYSWHARAESGPYFGPWSDTWTFKTPDIPLGYIHSDEVYDPLNNGKTVGQIFGPVTLIPNTGAKMEDLVSYIQYALPTTVTGGEISLLATNVHSQTQGGKTKIMAMSQGLSDITTNPRRFTIEKRGEPEDTVAWRVITNCERIETVGGERVGVDFDPNRWYLWQATFGNGNFNLTIREDNSQGKVVYSFGKPYCGSYNPDPQYVFAGGPMGRAGPDAGTVPGMVVKQFWMSSRPRPAFADR
jgi:hypothetical protein